MPDSKNKLDEFKGQIPKKHELYLGESLKFADDIEIKSMRLKSQQLINFIKENTCRHIKLNDMQLQRKQQSDDGLKIWKNNFELQKIQALAHLEREISRLSMTESSKARAPANYLMVIRELFKHICKKFSKLRIFVISILGLQSSRKSTLLNALFACRFAVSVGRCTVGSFYAAIIFGKRFIRTTYYLSFVLIDTEGLGAPEKMNDPESEKKIESVVTIARLEKVRLAPGIYILQHTSERNEAKISEAIEAFRDTAPKIANDKDIEIGISNTDCLQTLDKRIRSGQLLKQFRPFKNGATAYSPPSEQYHDDVVTLCNSIINDCKNLQNRIEFSKIGLQIPVLSVKCEECEECEKTNKENAELEKYLQRKNNKECEKETKQTIKKYIKLNHRSVLTKLTQMLGANFIRKGISSEALDIINERLENILRNILREGFSDQQREQEVSKIWSSSL
ncbi:hypothetical protein RhiirA1_454763 [Rhizophagus irregularis]|uniref:Uncharacterized protein n=2 Tax=Rhizophagus irregularis TaxID=588596 RepID=A0A2I1F5N2_9GLOM|nr:hypothetical protein RhiirA1_454763 [Rhizophagus irregularis]PKY29691.1 hypothetical protein RhiirB3_446408 [Rhizophagus irregularis]